MKEVKFVDGKIDLESLKYPKFDKRKTVAQTVGKKFYVRGKKSPLHMSRMGRVNVN